LYESADAALTLFQSWSRAQTRSPLHGGVDRNLPPLDRYSVQARSPLHGGVDRNMEVKSATGRLSNVRPFTGGVDRNSHDGPSLLGRDWFAPSRGRGSKQETAVPQNHSASVRPFTGRGSKPISGPRERKALRVRPFTGAWIETGTPTSSTIPASVRPFTGRGSKLLLGGSLSGRGEGSPLHGGVDRNLVRLTRTPCPKQFAPSRGRGSKLYRGHRISVDRGFAPSRGRGSKLGVFRQEASRDQRSPLHGGVDRNFSTRTRSSRSPGSPLHGGVDRNSGMDELNRSYEGFAPSRGRGSKHRGRDRGEVRRVVRPFTGAWIETLNT
jgi:hypothetical protein